ncbi:MAG TPA: hypothetical protein VNL70_00710, partial [Tepidisphaeraceae bacterium]|nr:hypothetical protein [Tepidisphaeraceae bacterium]
MTTTTASTPVWNNPDLPADLMTMDTARFIAHCRRLYRKTLLEDVVPFWLRHGIDRQYGGIGNLLDDAGNVTGTDKWLW